MRPGRVLVAAGLVAAAGLVGHEAWQRTGPTPPVPAELAELDPLVRGRIEEASAEVARRRRSRDAWLRLGMVYEANGLFGPAETCYSTLVARDDRDALALHRLACVEERGGDLARAAATMERAAAADPALAPSWVRLAWWCLDLGELERAEEALDRARALAPGEPAVQLGELRAELARGRFEAVAARLRGSGLLAGDHAGYAHHLLALALRGAGDVEGAAAAAARGDGRRFVLDDELARAVQREETGYAALRLRAGRDVAARRFEQAEPKLAQLLEHDPDDANSLDLLAVCRLEQGDSARALALLERVLALVPEHPEASIHFARAVLASKERDPVRLAQAAGRLARALESRADDPVLWRLAAALAEARRDPAGLVAALDRVVALDPAALDMRLRASYALIELGDAAEALARFRAIQSERPGELEARYGEVLALLHAERRDEARAALDALAARPEADARRLEQLRMRL